MQGFDIVRFTNHHVKTLSALDPGPSHLSRWVSILLTLAFFAVFAIPSPAQTYTIITTLDGTGAYPGTSPLVQGFDGNFYGASELGGANNQGVIYKVTPAGVLTEVYSFCAQANCTDGAAPASLVLGRDGNFYGSTLKGGTVTTAHGGYGTFFKITPEGALTTLSSHCGLECTDGNLPNPLVQAANGSFFGTSTNGGKKHMGSVFKMTAQGALTNLYSFCSEKNCIDGVDPESALTLATDGNLYGTTTDEILYHSTFFKVTPAGKLTTLHTFCLDVTTCLDGSSPAGVAVQGPDGDLYGMTLAGGNEGGGTIYKITTQGQLTTLYNFCGKANCPNGTFPMAGMALGTDGNFYGATAFGGDRTSGGCGDGCGTLFQMTPQGALTTLYKFCPQPKCADGRVPETPLVQGTDGSFYGLASGQGKHGGPIYKLDVGLAPFVKTLPAAGRAGVNVIILGNNLTGTTEVAFNGASAAFKLVSSTEITAKVPPGAATGSVTVTTPAGTLSSNIAFTVP